MKEQVYVHIPTPCHEDWDKMTPENKGRFCDSCAKTVVDFSVMTDNDVLNYLNKNKGNLCGRFADDQLQRPLIETQLQPKKGWKYWLASVASLFVLMNRGIAQGKPIVVSKKGTEKVSYGTKKNVHSPEPVTPVLVGKIAYNNKGLINGKIIDENDNAVIGASVTVKGTMAGIATDSTGHFSLRTLLAEKEVTLSITSIGFESKTIEIDITNNTQQIIQLKKKEIALPEVTVIDFGTISCTFRVGGISSYSSRRTIKKADTVATIVSKFLKNEKFTIYPNPVHRNGTITLAIKEAGDYEVQMLDNQSKLLYSQYHTTQSKTQAVSFPVPANALPGMYYLRLINDKTKKQWVDKLVVQ